MVVYGDLLFMINFSMDFLCFYFSCLLTHRKLPNLRAVVASSLGGIYSVAVLFMSVKQPLAFILDVFVLFLMCAIVYLDRGANLRSLVKMIALYFLVSSLLGGVMTALYSFLNRYDSIFDNIESASDMQMWVFLLLAMGGSALTVLGGKMMRSGASKRVVELEIVHGGRAAHLRALVDSGNLAVEPISGKSVVFVRLEALRDILDGEIYSALFLGDVQSLPLSVVSRIRFIPTCSVGGEALLPALRFDCVRVKYGNSRAEIEVYIAPVKDGAFGDCDAIISHEAMI